MPKITYFMYAAVIVATMAGLGAIGLSGFSTDLQLTDYDNETISQYNRLAELSEQTEEIEASASSIKEKEGALDIIGGFFSSTYQSLVLAKGSIDTVGAMTDDAIDDLPLGNTGSLIRSMLFLLILISIIIGVIVASIVKRDL